MHDAPDPTAPAPELGAARPGPPPMRAALLHGNVGAEISRMTWPMLGGMTAVISQPVIDSYFLGQLGLQELAAIQFILPVTLMVMSVTWGLGVGTTAILAQQIGSGQWDRVRSTVSYAHLLAMAVMLIFTLFGFFLLDDIFIALGAGPDLMPLVRAYMSVWLPGAFLLALPMTGNACMRANGEVKVSSLVMIVIAAGKLIFTPWFVFGGLGLPGLGIAGAAWATIVAHVLSASLAFYMLGIVGRMFDWSKPSFKNLRAIWARLLHVGAPTALTNMITPLSMIVVNTVLLRHGPEVLAGFGVGNRIEALAMILPFALATALVPFLGQNFAAGRTDRMADAVRLVLIFNFAFGAGLAIAMGLAASRLGAVFSADPAAIAATRTYLTVIPFSYGLYGTMVIMGMAFVALGNAAPNLIFFSVRLFLLYIPGTLLGNALFGYIGIVAAAAAANVVAGSLALYWYWRYFPRPAGKAA